MPLRQRYPLVAAGLNALETPKGWMKAASESSGAAELRPLGRVMS
jgi:hypothetical protein